MSRVRVIEIMRRGPRGAPGDMDPAEWDALQDELDAKLPIADVLNEPDMASNATDKPPSQASVVAYVEDELEAGLATKLDDTLSPVLLMSPDGSRDQRGAVTPTMVGTVTTVTGEYGNAWHLASSDAAVRVPKADYWPTGAGTVLVRAKLSAAPSASDSYSVIVSGSSPNRFGMGTSPTPNPRVMIGANIHTQTLTPAIDFQAMHVHAVRFDASTVQQWINGQALPELSYTGTPIGSSSYIQIMRWVSGSTPYDVESVLIFDQALSDAEIVRISTMDEAWTWETARLLFPGVAGLAAHLADTNNPHGVTKTQVGLGNVDNTSDLAKPVSTAQQAALDLKADLAALLAHTGNTKNPHGVKKAHVGLGRVDNTSDAEKPLSAAMQAAINQMRSELALDHVRQEGDILFVGADGPRWGAIDDVINGSADTTARFGYGDFGDGSLPG